MAMSQLTVQQKRDSFGVDSGVQRSPLYILSCALFGVLCGCSLCLGGWMPVHAVVGNHCCQVRFFANKNILCLDVCTRRLFLERYHWWSGYSIAPQVRVGFSIAPPVFVSRDRDTCYSCGHVVWWVNSVTDFDSPKADWTTR